MSQKSYARYAFSGAASANQLSQEDVSGDPGADVVVNFGYLYDTNGVVIDEVVSKEHGALLCDQMRRTSQLSAEDLDRIEGQLKTCDQLAQTLCRFESTDEPNESKKKIAAVRTYGSAIQVRSKQFTQWHITREVQKYRVRPETAKKMIEDVRASDLPDSCAEVVVVDGHIRLLDTNGDHFGLPIVSYEQAIMQVRKLLKTEQITADEMKKLRRDLVARCREAGHPQYVSCVLLREMDGMNGVLVVTCQAAGIGMLQFSKHTAHNEIERLVAKGDIARDRSFKLHNDVDKTDLPDSTARLAICESGQTHLIDEFAQLGGLHLHSKRQALDQLNEATRNERIYPKSQQRIERQIAESDLPDTHESDKSYLHAHAKDCMIFTELLH